MVVEFAVDSGDGVMKGFSLDVWKSEDVFM